MPQVTLPNKQQVENLDNKIGVNTNAAGTTTIFARVRQIYEYCVNTLKTAIDTITSNVGSNADTSSASGSVHAKLKDIKTTVASSGGIKSIQRGFFNTSIAQGGTQNIIVSSVNMSKSKLNLISSHAFGDYTGSIYLRLTSSTNIVVGYTGTGGYTPNLSWELIEYN